MHVMHHKNYIQKYYTFSQIWFKDPHTSEMLIVEIRNQFAEQLRCLEQRTETQVALINELQDFFRRRAEVLSISVLSFLDRNFDAVGEK